MSQSASFILGSRLGCLMLSNFISSSLLRTSISTTLKRSTKALSNIRADVYSKPTFAVAIKLTPSATGTSGLSSFSSNLILRIFASSTGINIFHASGFARDNSSSKMTDPGVFNAVMNEDSSKYVPSLKKVLPISDERTS